MSLRACLSAEVAHLCTDHLARTQIAANQDVTRICNREALLLVCPCLFCGRYSTQQACKLLQPSSVGIQECTLSSRRFRMRSVHLGAPLVYAAYWYFIPQVLGNASVLSVSQNVCRLELEVTSLFLFHALISEEHIRCSDSCVHS